jgi:hypothetical protein
MRIATRLWIALLITIVFVLGAGVLIRVRHEQRVLLEVTRRDRRFFAVVLQTALSRPGEAADPLEEARLLLAREEIAEAHINTRLVSTGPSSNLPKPRLASAQIAPLQHGEVVVESYGGELLTYVPLEQRDVALELAEPHAIDSLLTRIGWQSLWTPDRARCRGQRRLAHQRAHDPGADQPHDRHREGAAQLRAPQGQAGRRDRPEGALTTRRAHAGAAHPTAFWAGALSPPV